MSAIQRLGEGSTWAGLSAVFATLAQVAPHYAAIFQSLTVIGAGIAAAIPDKGAQK